MAEKIDVPLAGGSLAFDCDFTNLTWSAPAQLDEGDFPIAFERGGKRYELYSNNTFAEVELP